MTEKIQDKQTILPNDPPRYAQAIEEGNKQLNQGNNKADVARAVFRVIHAEPREVDLRAFIEGADVTQKGAPTCYYNINRKLRKNKQV